MDFRVDVNGTLNLLGATFYYALEVPHLLTLASKVYGDTPNHLPFIELETQREIEPNHTYNSGIQTHLT